MHAPSQARLGTITARLAASAMDSISVRFRRDHRALLDTFNELENAVEGADQGTISRVWTEFERALDRHLDAEEQLILPCLEKKHPAEVKEIRREHAEIRKLLGDLGIRADLNTLRADVADALVQKLEEHAAREESGIYAWADAEIPAPRKGLFRALAERTSRVY
jgi:hemerythrin-like domain-containing protein